MKKLLLLFLLMPFMFISCSSDDDDNSQDYTSFVFHLPESIDVKLTNCIAANKKENKYYIIGNLGDITKGKTSSEIRINDNSITEVYFFTDYNGCVRFNKTFVLKTNCKNEFILEESIGGISVTDKSDPYQYPQEP